MNIPEENEYLSIDEIIDRALELCDELPDEASLREHAENIADLRERLYGGRLRIAVLGQFNRGKSTFINALLGLSVLPTSVLPITSVPTVIAWGEENSSTVELADGATETATNDQPDAVAAHLSRFVTEKNNPENTLGVQAVTVKCPSEMLRHGTVIIDTPGFGSTHTHNTQTTIDMLASCDAALFLLSADLPITQVEVDFLHRVVLTVPRLFFIYNKTDLLEGEELETTRAFILDTLDKEFHFGPDLTLYPVSAKSYMTSRDKENAWKTCGLETIEKEIITFLLREKYFALSEALSGKFKTALDGIRSILALRKQSLTEPLAAARDLAGRTGAVEKATTDTLSRDAALAIAERGAIVDRCRTECIRRIDESFPSFDARLTRIIAQAPQNRAELLVSAAAGPMFEEWLGSLFISLVNKAARSAAKASLAHERELSRIRDTFCTELLLPEDALDDIDLPVEMEIDTTDASGSFITLDLTPFRASFGDVLSSGEKRTAALLAHYRPQMRAALDNAVDALVAQLETRINPPFARYTQEAAAFGEDLRAIIIQRADEARTAVAALEAVSTPELARLTDLDDRFAALRTIVV